MKRIFILTVIMAMVLVCSMQANAAPGPPGSQGPEGPQGLPGAIDVYDANGQYLGQLSSVSSPYAWIVSIYIQSLKSIIILDGVGDIESNVVLKFQSNDCTGQPYASRDNQLIVKLV